MRNLPHLRLLYSHHEHVYLFQQDRRGLLATAARQKCSEEYEELKFSATQISLSPPQDPAPFSPGLRIWTCVG